MFVENGKISKRQFLVLLIFALFGTSLLFLPAELAREGGGNGWQACLFWGIAILAVQSLLCHLCKRNPGFSMETWYAYAFGKTCGKILSLGFLCYIAFVGAMELRVFGEVISAMMLPKTPLWLVSAVFLLGCLPVVVGGVEVVGRMAEVLFFFMAIPLLVVLVALAFSVDFGRLLPVILVDGETMQKTAAYFAPISQGLLLTPFFFAHTKWKRSSGNGWAVGIVAVMLLVMCFMTILAFCAYGEDVLSVKMFPSLQMMERMGLANVFLSRQDLLFLWFWMVSTYLFLSMTLLFATNLWYHILNVPKAKQGGKWGLFWCVLFWVVSNVPKDLWGAYDLRLSYLPYGNLIFLVILPLILLVVDFVKRGRLRG